MSAMTYAPALCDIAASVALNAPGCPSLLRDLVVQAARDAYEIDAGLHEDYRTMGPAEMKAVHAGLGSHAGAQSVAGRRAPVDAACVMAARWLLELDETLIEPMRSFDPDAHDLLVGFFAQHPRIGTPHQGAGPHR